MQTALTAYWRLHPDSAACQLAGCEQLLASEGTGSPADRTYADFGNQL
jgi:hypothetical protein